MNFELERAAAHMRKKAAARNKAVTIAQKQKQSAELKAQATAEAMTETSKVAREAFRAERASSPLLGPEASSPGPTACDLLDSQVVVYRKTLVALPWRHKGQQGGAEGRGPSFDSSGPAGTAAGTPSPPQRRGSHARSEFSGPLDKLILPDSVLADVGSEAHSSQVEYPLTFQLYCPLSKRTTHAGVLEFTAGEGTVCLPSKVAECLGLPGSGALAKTADGLTSSTIMSSSTSSSPSAASSSSVQASEKEVVVTYANLPKGTFARFEVLDDNLTDITDIRATLEYALRMSFTVLTVGDTFSVQVGGGQISRMRVLELAPETAVSVIDTDMEVDIIKPTVTEHFDSQSALQPDDGSPVPSSLLPPHGDDSSSPTPAGNKHSSSRQLTFHQSVKGMTVGCNNSIEFRVPVPGDEKALLDRGCASVEIKCTEISPSDGLDLYVSFPPLREASVHSHHIAHLMDETAEGDKVITVTLQEIQCALETHKSTHTNFDRLAMSYGSEGLSSPEKPRASSLTSEQLKEIAERGGAARPRSGSHSLATETEWPSVLYVGVHGCALAGGSTQFSLRVCLNDAPSEPSLDVVMGDTCDGPSPGRDGSPQDIPVLPAPPLTKRCDTCMRPIALATYELHTAQCSRHCTICTVCGVLLRRSSSSSHVHCELCGDAMDSSRAEKHRLVWHTSIECKCGAEFERAQMLLHQRTDCPERIVMCKFCAIPQPAGDESGMDVRDRVSLGLTAHEARCGGRTVRCDFCKKFIMLKEMDLHILCFHSKTPNPPS